jgi:hypothetical protein
MLDAHDLEGPGETPAAATGQPTESLAPAR